MAGVVRGLRAEHDAKEVGVLDREDDISDARFPEARGWIVREPFDPLEHLAAQGAEPLLGHGGDESGLVGEVVIGCHVTDAGLAGDGAHGEGVEAVALNDVEGGVDEGGSELAVVVGFFSGGA